MRWDPPSILRGESRHAFGSTGPRRKVRACRVRLDAAALLNRFSLPKGFCQLGDETGRILVSEALPDEVGLAEQLRPEQAGGDVEADPLIDRTGLHPTEPGILQSPG